MLDFKYYCVTDSLSYNLIIVQIYSRKEIKVKLRFRHFVTFGTVVAYLIAIWIAFAWYWAVLLASLFLLYVLTKTLFGRMVRAWIEFIAHLLLVVFGTAAAIGIWGPGTAMVLLALYIFFGFFAK